MGRDEESRGRKRHRSRSDSPDRERKREHKVNDIFMCKYTYWTNRVKNLKAIDASVATVVNEATEVDEEIRAAAAKIRETLGGMVAMRTR